MTSALLIDTNGASIAIGAARPIESAAAIDSKKAGVASGNGLPDSGPMRMRGIRARAMNTDAFDNRMTFRPSRYTSSSGVS